MKNIKKYWSVLGIYLKTQWIHVTILAIIFSISIVLQLVVPQILRFFIDSAKENEPLVLLVRAAILFFIVALVQQLTSVGVTYFSQNIGWRATNQLREDLVKHCLNLDMSFHKKFRPGDLIERIDGDVTMMFNFFSNLLVEVIGHLALMIGILVLLFIENIYLGLTMTLFVFIALFIMKKIQTIAIPYHIKVREKSTSYYGYLGEVLENIEDISTNGAINKIIWKFKKISRELLPAQLKASMASITMWNSTLLIFAIGNALAFGIGGLLWSKAIISVGTVYLIFHYTEMLSMPLREIQYQLTDLQKAGAGIERIQELLNTKSNIVVKDEELLPKGALALEIANMSFKYEDDEDNKLVLDDISLKLEPGKILGVLGRTGSGKSTLARLINRFYDVTSGDILINEKRIDNISLKDIRSKIAFVTQEVQLFNASIKDNLTFFNNNIKDETIWKALKHMGLDEWVNTLPNGIDTVLKSDSGGLSAGEAQLIAFVRVFIKNPGIVILDEASSRLDPLTEKIMDSAIKKLFENRTGIIIAHRLQTIERADDILIIDQGKILEYGNKLELVNNIESHFSNLLNDGIKEVLV